MQNLSEVAPGQWVIEGHPATPSAARALVHEDLATLGMDAWDLEETTARLRFERAHFREDVGFCSPADFPGARPIVAVNGMPQIASEQSADSPDES